MISSLTAYEMQLVTDPQILLAKNNIIKVVYKRFGDLASRYQKELEDITVESEASMSAKISRGENYKGLPYVIMDYPRHFSKTDVFAIRTFFWWGNFFSITLQLSGQYQSKYANNIEGAIRHDCFSGWFIGNSANQWEHHFETGNYMPVEKDKDYNVDKLPFLKLAKKIPLGKWDEIDSFFTGNFSLLIKVLTSYAPIR
ncbi:MAG: hypothetical protein JWQ40_4388 [Segetibacter sp.]|jgi:hypothetical protein|nr:hypothetical protein [Segetibacter sp.]